MRSLKYKSNTYFHILMQRTIVYIVCEPTIVNLFQPMAEGLNKRIPSTYQVLIDPTSIFTLKRLIRFPRRTAFGSMDLVTLPDKLRSYLI